MKYRKWDRRRAARVARRAVGVRGSARFGVRCSLAAHGVRGGGAVARASNARSRRRAGVRLCCDCRQRPLPVSGAVAGRPDGSGRRDRAIRRHGAGHHGRACRASRPRALAKALVALDVLSDGRVIAGVGPGSSQGDYDAVGVSYEERWQRFDEAAAILRSLLRGGPPPQSHRRSSSRHRTRAARSTPGSADPAAADHRQAADGSRP